MLSTHHLPFALILLGLASCAGGERGGGGGGPGNDTASASTANASTANASTASVSSVEEPNDFDGVYDLKDPDSGAPVGTMTFTNHQDYTFVPSSCASASCSESGTYTDDGNELALKNAATGEVHSFSIEETGAAATSLVGGGVSPQDWGHLYGSAPGSLVYCPNRGCVGLVLSHQGYLVCRGGPGGCGTPYGARVGYWLRR
jgi:hypothetical protein